MNKTVTAVYRFKEGLYINITNRCPNLCVFCIKTKWNMQFEGNDLNLRGAEPTVDEILAALRAEMAKKPAKEIVFCGYGESTYRLKDMLTIAETIKKEFPGVTTRLNTVGLGSVINGRDITPELEGKIDEIFVSLNSTDPAQWAELVRPDKNINATLADVIDFIRKAVPRAKRVVASIVDKQGADAEAAKKLAESLGAEFYKREFLDER